MPVDMKWLAEEFEEWDKEQVRIRKRGYYRLRRLDGSSCVVQVDSNGKKIRELDYGEIYNFKIVPIGIDESHHMECRGVLVSVDEDDNFIFMSYGRKVVVGLKDILDDNPKTVS